MDIGGPAWDEARRAWRRLTGGAKAFGGDAAIVALSDISLLRRLLDQAELAAVRSARRAGRPWAEIATHLGITRQSAWERWRELDDASTGTEAEPSAEPTSAVAVPDVIGLAVGDAARALRDAGFVAGEHNTGGPVMPLRPEVTAIVSDQVPRGGARRRRGSTVALWLDYGGGGGGVREPRRPKPSPRAGAPMSDPRQY